MAFSGIHHIAIATNDMRAQIEFFTQVVGMRLVGLFPMHGVEATSHCFVDAGGGYYLSFIEKDEAKVDPVIGVSHPVDSGGPVAGGAMNHLALAVDTYEDLMDLRDRLRSNGYSVVGPLDHGVSWSMYFGGPEGLLLEFATGDRSDVLEPERWIDPETAAHLGYSDDDLQRYTSPPAFASSGGRLPQPDPETSVYPTPIPRPMFDAVWNLDDEELTEALRFVPDGETETTGAPRAEVS